MNLSLDTLNLPNGKLVDPLRISSGQPDPSALARVCAAGIRHVVNLRPSTEDAGFDSPATVEKLGMRYHSLPIAGPAGLTADNVRRFDALLAEIGEQPTLIHCASGNRVGALFALRAGWLQGKSADEALAIGAQAGLTQMSAVVAPLLQQKP